jgi:hypothetical protein
MISEEPVKMRRIFACWAGCALLAITVVQAGSPAPAIANLRMNAPQAAMPKGRLGRPAEAIAADPTGTLLVAAWETMQGTCGQPFGAACTPPPAPGITAFGTSADGGRTWTDAGAPFLPGDVMTSGHPWLDTGGVDNRTFFLVSRARSTAATAPDYTPGGSGQVGLVFYRGRFKDGVLTWSDQHPFSPRRAQDLLRSPSLFAAKDGSGKVYVTLSNLRGVCNRPGTSSGQIEMLRSADEGKTWEGPVIVGPDDTLDTVNPKDPRCGSDGTYQVQSTGGLGPHGEIYVAWQFGPKVINPFFPVKTNHTLSVRFARSLDGGATFSKPQDLVKINAMREDPPVGYSKYVINDGPRLAVGAVGGHGRIYVTYAAAAREVETPYAEQSVVSTQAYLIYSDDRGATWSTPRPLAPPEPPTGIKRFWPSVAVRNDGAVDVVYLESQEKPVNGAPGGIDCTEPLTDGGPRKGGASSLVDVYWVQSTDGGASFGAPVRVTSETSNWCKVAFDKEGTQFGNFGDFIGITTAGDRAFAVWPDGRNGVPDAYFAELPRSPGTAAPASGHR